MTVWVLIHVQYIPNSVSAKLHQSHDTSPQDIHNGLILCEHTHHTIAFITPDVEHWLEQEIVDKTC